MAMAWAVDGIDPQRTITPETEQEVAEALAEARSAGQAVIPMGGGTMLQVGNLPQRYDLALSTAKLTGIVEYTPADLTVVVRAGTALAALDGELSEHGQFLPLGVPLPSKATLGGALAANASGPWRTAYGSARDMVIGMRMALPSGTVAKSGGRVVKNVAGYDLAKLFIGSFGTLGVITEVALKIYPRPSVVHTLISEIPDLASALRTAGSIRDLGPGILDLQVASAGLGAQLGLDGPALLVTVGGGEAATGELVSQVEDLAGARSLDGEAGARLKDALRDFPATATAKLSVLPARLGELADPGSRHTSLLYPAVGVAYLRAPDLTVAEGQALREQITARGGSLVLLDTPAAWKGEVDAWGTPGPELALMKKVKDVFDPERVMSPGRFIGGI